MGYEVLEADIHAAKKHLAEVKARFDVKKASEAKTRETRLKTTMDALDSKIDARKLGIASQFYDTTVTEWNEDLNDFVTGPTYDYGASQPATNIYPDVLKAISESPTLKVMGVEDAVEKLVAAAQSGDAKLNQLYQAREKVYKLWCTAMNRASDMGAEVREAEYDVKEAQKSLDEAKAYQARKAKEVELEAERKKTLETAGNLATKILTSRKK